MAATKVRALCAERPLRFSPELERTMHPGAHRQWCVLRAVALGMLAGCTALALQVVTVLESDQAELQRLGMVVPAGRWSGAIGPTAPLSPGGEEGAPVEPGCEEPEITVTADCAADRRGPVETPRAAAIAREGTADDPNWAATAASSGEHAPAEPTPTPPPAAGVAPTLTVANAASKVLTYTVAPGETLSSLAGKFGVSVRTIARANKLTEPDAILAGRQLLILRIPGTLHTVAEGDSLFALAERYGVIPEEIAAANGLADSHVIHPGDRLLIPEAVDEHLAEPDDPATRSTRQPQGQQTHEVVAGDTLTRIATRFGVPLEALVMANGLDLSKPLAVGQRLTIPPAGAVEHVVRDGDTVTGIAALYGAKAIDIIRTNSLADPYVLSAGQRLLVPGGTTQPTPSRRTTTPTASALAPTSTPTARPIAGASARLVYEVVAGDTLTRIATRFGVPLEALVMANGLGLSKPLAVGQRLTIPSGGQAQPRVAATATLTPRPQPTQAPAGRSEVGVRVVGMAMRYLGARYIWGGASQATGFDCSGLVMYVFRQAGVPVPRDLWGQFNSGSKVDRTALRPGDVVFFQNTYRPGLSHAGIYNGNGQFIHAAGENAGVIISSLGNPYWMAHYLGASRLY